VYIFDLVRQKREERGLTQQQLADKAGVSLYVVKRIETDKPYNPLATKFSAIRNALEIDHEVFWEAECKTFEKYHPEVI
jgi:transcriptional regulator with XRE-family HTH domain